MNETKEGVAVEALRKALDGKFGQDIVVMDLRGLTTIADYFVIVTGTSQPQMAALADTAEETLSAHGLQMSHAEGVNTGNWVLLDFGSVIVHLFDKESRPFYNLERVWGDARAAGKE
ncbi:MAG: ribosome silencing factor [Defluviitaleaceae bacterium]|nr:ribosome silencing factor [Defluviitaleaceae bacterium]MCL2240488.1 ribosome silencing factor [Defluviitaleaceae bacterium]